MRACALVGAAYFDKEHFKSQTFDCVIAVDAGYRHLQEIDVVPDVVLGDFDSLGYTPEHHHVLSFAAQKDKSDIEIALEFAEKEYYDTLVVYGCLGGRLDHTYGVTQLIARFSKRGLRVYAVGEDFVVTALTGAAHSSLSFSEGATGIFSAFAFDPVVQGVCEEGLEYTLNDKTLAYTEPLGVSNSFIGKSVYVSVKEGTLLVFFPVAAWGHLEFDAEED